MRSYMSNSRLQLTVEMLMQLTSNIIKTAGLNMSQMYFVNTRKHQTRASEVAAKIEFVTMAQMALKSVKIRNMSQLQAAYDTILQENNVKAKTYSRNAIKKLIQAEIEDVEFPTTDSLSGHRCLRPCS